jgi:alpha-beta hydrolase superfamily lysophospholipase
MAHSESSFVSAVDGLKIFTQSWLPEGDPRAVIVLVHGLGEHSSRYGHVAAAFNAAGYAVYALDHRGHGKSGGERAYFAAFDHAVSDLKQYVDSVKAAQPGKKQFIYCHSLGTLIGLSYALRYGADLRGMVVSSTPLEVESHTAKLLVWGASLLNRIAPKTPIASLPPQFLSTDPAAVSAYEQDPLNDHQNPRARMGYHVMHVSRAIKAGMSSLKMPLFIIHGGDDKICPPSGSNTLHGGAGSADKTLKIYPGLYHEIHNEKVQSAILADVVAWLNAHA